MEGENDMLQNIEFDYQKLKKRISEKVGSAREMANILGIAETSFSRKMNNKVGFSTEDIMRMKEILEIETEDIGVYFFTPLN